jgi:quercetin dioxygenase-like cupin family protein
MTKRLEPINKLVGQALESIHVNMMMKKDLSNQINWVSEQYKRGQVDYIPAYQESFEMADGWSAKLRMSDDDVFDVYVAKGQKGSILPRHAHVQKEIIFVSSGVIEVCIDGVTNTFKSGDTISIPSNVKHQVLAVESCELFVLFRPPITRYTPNNSNGANFFN